MSEKTLQNDATRFFNNEELFHALQIRKSTRTYSGVQLKPEHIKIINNYLQSNEMMTGPFGDTFRIKFMNGVDTDEQIATYGYIKKFKAILMAISTAKPRALFEMAYVLHGLVLQLTQSDVQTVWIGGAFNHKDAIDASDMQEDEIIAAVIPLGYESSKKRLLFDYIAPIILGAKHRKDMKDIYYKNDFNSPLNEGDTKFYEALDLARRAPSAKNKQPWRVVVDNNDKNIHLYAKFNLRDEVGNGRKQYACPPEYLDLGAYFRSLEITLQHFGFKGTLSINKPEIAIPIDLDMEYIATWTQS